MKPREAARNRVAAILQAWRNEGQMTLPPPSSKDEEIAWLITKSVESILFSNYDREAEHADQTK